MMDLQSKTKIQFFFEMSSQEWKYPSLPPKPFVIPANTISLLDNDNNCSELGRSNLRGFYNLSIIFVIIFFITKPIVNFIDHGYLLEPTLYSTFKKDLLFCIMTWPIFFIWSFTSYILQLLIIKGLNKRLAQLFQHLTQSGLFIYSAYIVLENQWCTTHTLFVVCQACVHFMKMHSYCTVNSDYREDYQNSKKLNTPSKSLYPTNINLGNFIEFMFTPWIVYAQYPRRSSRSWVYILKKAISFVFHALLLYLIHSEYMLPFIEMGVKISYMELCLRCILPLTFLIVIGFYMVFDCLCNLFAELSYLDFREFYQDWWNSMTFQEFNRKWNRPVYNFLYRHLYLEVMVRYSLNKRVAQIITFLFSALLHQFLAFMIFKVIRPLMFFSMLGQIPLIFLTKWMINRKIGHYVFWLGLLLGSALLLSGYLRIDQSVTKHFTKKAEQP